MFSQSRCLDPKKTPETCVYLAKQYPWILEEVPQDQVCTNRLLKLPGIAVYISDVSLQVCNKTYPGANIHPVGKDTDENWPERQSRSELRYKREGIDPLLEFLRVK